MLDLSAPRWCVPLCDWVWVGWPSCSLLGCGGWGGSARVQVQLPWMTGRGQARLQEGLEGGGCGEVGQGLLSARWGSGALEGRGRVCWLADWLAGNGSHHPSPPSLPGGGSAPFPMVTLCAAWGLPLQGCQMALLPPALGGRWAGHGTSGVPWVGGGPGMLGQQQGGWGGWTPSGLWG